MIRGIGADTLLRGEGVDQLSGGSGDDTIYFDSADALVDGGVGHDVAWADYITDGVSLDLAAGSIEEAHGGKGNDVLDASATTGGVRLFSVDINGSADVLIGGFGDDVFSFDFFDTIQGGVGNDVAYGGGSGGVNVNLASSNMETVWGTAFPDWLDRSGATQSVTIVGLGGADILSGGAGDDFIYFDGADIAVLGGNGYDVAFGGGGVVVNMSLAGTGLEQVWGGALDDTLNGEGVTANLVLNGGGGADNLQGGSSDDFLYFDDADVTVIGGAGSDWAVAFAGSGSVNVNLGNQELENAWGSLFSDTLSAGTAMHVSLVGDAGNDILTGGDGGDFLYGFGDNDTLTGGAGNDNLVGGTGTDTFAFGAGWGTDIVWDWVNGSDSRAHGCCGVRAGRLPFGLLLNWLDSGSEYDRYNYRKIAALLRNAADGVQKIWDRRGRSTLAPVHACRM